jgi:hypothetical protein
MSIVVFYIWIWSDSSWCLKLLYSWSEEKKRDWRILIEHLPDYGKINLNLRMNSLQLEKTNAWLFFRNIDIFLN